MIAELEVKQRVYDPFKTYKFVLNHQNNNPSMDGVYFPESHAFVAEDIIFYNNKRRVIRYIEGEQSIFADEQKEIAGEPKKRGGILEFKKGILDVKGEETQLLDFLFLHSKNGSNPNADAKSRPMFFLLDNTEGLRAEMEAEKIRAEAINWCFNAPFSDVKSYARSLNINLSQEEAEVRWSMKIIAEQPDKTKMFLQDLKSPVRKKMHFIYEAIDQKFLIKDGNSLSWAKSGVPIWNSPLGVDVVHSFAENIDGSTNNERAYDMIKYEVQAVSVPKNLGKTQSQLETERYEQREAQKSEEVASIKSNDSDERFEKVAIRAFVDKCVNRQILERQGVKLVYGERIFGNYLGLLSAMRKDECSLYNELKEKLEANPHV